MWTSKSAPNPRCFNDFDFQIALARRRGANFVDILDSRSFATPVFRTYLCELSKRQNYGKTQHFAQFLPPKHLCCENIDAARATGNFQYSRKLELLNFLWWVLYSTPNYQQYTNTKSIRPTMVPTAKITVSMLTLGHLTIEKKLS